jgi:thioredoxin-dependent peroxiredoxin
MTRRLLRLSVLAALLAAATPTAFAQAPELKVGDVAPPFTLPGSDGKLHSLSAQLGVRPVVLAWFPKVLATL